MPSQHYTNSRLSSGPAGPAVGIGGAGINSVVSAAAVTATGNAVVSAGSGGVSSNMEQVKGVYRNSRFMHTMTSLIGETVQVELVDKTRWEGILKTFSPDVSWSLLF